MYVFRTGVLQKLLAAAGSQDMGRDLIPAAVEAGLNVSVCGVGVYGCVGGGLVRQVTLWGWGRVIGGKRGGEGGKAAGLETHASGKWAPHVIGWVQ